MDYTALMGSMMTQHQNKEKETEYEEGRVYSNDRMLENLSSAASGKKENNIAAFKKYIEENKDKLSEYATDIQYSYKVEPQIFRTDKESPEDHTLPLQTNPPKAFDSMDEFSAGSSTKPVKLNSETASSVWFEISSNQDILNQQYDIVDGRLPENKQETVLIVSQDREISDYVLYALGIRDIEDLNDLLRNPPEEGSEQKQTSYSFEELKAIQFKLVPNAAFYQKEDGVWKDIRTDADSVNETVNKGLDIRIVGVVMPKEDSSVSYQGIGYTSDLSAYLIEENNRSEIVREQKTTPKTDILTGKPFQAAESGNPDLSSLSPEEQAYFATLSPEEQTAMLKKMSSASTYEKNLELLGVADPEKPSVISVYPKNFDAKNGIEAFIGDYNKTVDEEDEIIYTDYVKMMMSSVTNVIDVISTILISFVAVSLVVSSIMIGIITYISVLERTKEIGILRSIGASKKDVSRVFNAETTVIGFAAGGIGIFITLLLTIPANMIVSALTGVGGVVVLPWQGALILIAISVILTFIAGLIPAGIAAKKDPVVALRTE